MASSEASLFLGKGLDEEPGLHSNSKQNRIGNHLVLGRNLVPEGSTATEKAYFLDSETSHCLIRGFWNTPGQMLWETSNPSSNQKNYLAGKQIIHSWKVCIIIWL